MPEILYAEQPADLVDQVIRLAHSHTVRLPPSERADFVQEVLAEVFERWPQYRPPEMGGAKLSVWVMYRIMKVWKNTTRDIQRGMNRYVPIDFNSADENGLHEAFVYSNSVTPYVMDERAEAKAVHAAATYCDMMLDEVLDYMPFSDDELFVMELKMNGWPISKIAEEAGLPAADVRKMAKLIRTKLKAARVIMTGQPSNAIDQYIQRHLEEHRPFPDTPFEVAVHHLGSEQVLHGIRGIRTAARVANAASTIRHPCEVSIKFGADPAVAFAFWQKYRNIIAKCSGLEMSASDDGLEIHGRANYKDGGADVIWGVMMAESCQRMNRVRASAPFAPNHQDFNMMVYNMRAQRFAEGPAVDGAVAAWRDRIGG